LVYYNHRNIASGARRSSRGQPFVTRKVQSSMETADAVVIGAGVVGLAVARRLARSGREVILLEAAAAIGSQTSSRNSEVIHAGIYYPRDSLKARLCVSGRDALYDYCRSHGVKHRQLGKIIVAATAGEIPALSGLQEKAAANGVHDLQLLDGAQARALEPALTVEAALLSPSTGIVDSHGLMLALQGDAEDRGAMIAFNTPVAGGEIRGGAVSGARGGSIVLRTGGAAPMEIACRSLVNAAGLQAQALAHALEGMPEDAIPQRRLAKGNYYLLAGASPFGRLVYPLPEKGGLGVHATLDLGGQCRFGPDVEWLEDLNGADLNGGDPNGGDPGGSNLNGGNLNYDVDPARAMRFYGAVRRYWPSLADGALLPGYAGIRPKLVTAPGSSGDADFVIQGAEAHGIAGLVNLFGIESPGLTACLSIADEVEKRLREQS
jgi:L-2-hydroxyglutarate oxidase LhgO